MYYCNCRALSKTMNEKPNIVDATIKKNLEMLLEADSTVAFVHLLRYTSKEHQT